MFLKKLSVLLGGILSAALLIVALWAWGRAGRLTQSWERPEVAAWAVRCAAMSVAALAQVLLVTLVVNVVYARDLIADLFRRAAMGVCAAATISAAALGLAGR